MIRILKYSLWLSMVTILFSCNTDIVNTNEEGSDSNTDNEVKEVVLTEAKFSNLERAEAWKTLLGNLEKSGLGEELKTEKVGSFHGILTVRRSVADFAKIISGDLTNKANITDVLYNLSPILFTQEEASSTYKEMLMVNPKFVDWAFETIVPDTKEQIGDKTAQEVYNTYGKTMIRLLVEGYLIIQKNDAQRVVGKYKEAFQYELDRVELPRDIELDDDEAWEFELMVWLWRFFDHAMPEYQGGLAGSSWTGGASVGFWCRRYIDGSAANIWKGLSQQMELYDGEWFKKIQTKEYPYLKDMEPSSLKYADVQHFYGNW